LEQIFNHNFEPPIRSIPAKAAARPAVRPRRILHANLCLALSCIGCVRQIQQQFGEPQRLADNNVGASETKPRFLLQCKQQY